MEREGTMFSKYVAAMKLAKIAGSIELRACMQKMERALGLGRM